MKLIAIVLLSLFVTSCGLPQPSGPVYKNPPTNPIPGPSEVPTPDEPTPTETTPTPIPAPLPPAVELPSIPVTAQDEITSYVKSFEARNLLAGGALNPVELNVTLESMPTNILGTCSMNTHTVKLNSFYWSQLSAGHKEELVFHELGHCVLGRYHDDTLGQDGKPISIMHSIHMGPTVYLRSTSAYRSYMAELFHTTSHTFSALVFNASNYPTQVYASTLKSSRSVQASTQGPETIQCPNH